VCYEYTSSVGKLVVLRLKGRIWKWQVSPEAGKFVPPYMA